ncbi:NAD(P)/FAD-dependent oxidoreductase [Shouchella patagoniensis]|uniref:NAD(P)/FAD-dependent oxidoreductase n=1 Tax=Shouchella patagoniensis TaxID=228576 RepID=UPI000995607E|nr:NAD(P)/FAD-dependent oxidoreductase [Shouchella patagoniensis]
MLDCIVIGGGPAGLNAALVLGRARKNVILFDEDKPRNRVTSESHGFITRDGIEPAEFKRIAHQDLAHYPSVSLYQQRVVAVEKEGNSFLVEAADGTHFTAKKVLLTTGLVDILPNIKGIESFYGKSLFSCPFCDGWEMRDKALVVISKSTDHAVHIAKLLTNWSDDIIVCTNGKCEVSGEDKALLAEKKITVIEDEINKLSGENGHLQTIQFVGGKEIKRDSGIVMTDLIQATDFASSLELEVNQMGGVVTDMFGRTNQVGVYSAGDHSIAGPSQLIIAAAEGNKAAVGVIADLTEESFQQKN